MFLFQTVIVKSQMLALLSSVKPLPDNAIENYFLDLCQKVLTKGSRGLLHFIYLRFSLVLD